MSKRSIFLLSAILLITALSCKEGFGLLPGEETPEITQLKAARELFRFNETVTLTATVQPTKRAALNIPGSVRKAAF